MSALFDDLPNEILASIFEYVPRSRKLCDLRLVSRRFRDSVTPAVFSILRVHTGFGVKYPLLRTLKEELAAKDVPVLRHIQHLTVITCPLEQNNPGRVWFEFLELLVPNLTNVRKVSWVYASRKLGCAPRYSSDQEFPDGAIERLAKSLGALPHLKELHLELSIDGQDPEPDIPLEPFAGLHALGIVWSFRYRPVARTLLHTSRILARCPGIEVFSSSVQHADNTVAMSRFRPHLHFEEVLGANASFSMDLRLKSVKTRGVVVNRADWQARMRHFRHLERLNIGFDPSTSAATNIGEILKVLSAEHIYLKEIEIDVLHHPGVFQYMSSYTGLERIAIRPRHPLDDSSRLVDQFFCMVLPLHASSLKSLTVGHNQTTVWSRDLPAEYLGQVAACTQLLHISCWISITSEDVAVKCADTLIAWLELCLRLPSLQHLECTPVSLQRPSVRYELKESDLWANVLVRSMVETFVEKNHVLFSIDAGYNYEKNFY